MTDALAAHGTLIAREEDSAGSPGVFTTIGEIGDITAPEFGRPSTEVTPHNDLIDGYVMGVIRRGEMSFPINYVPTDGSHDHLTGLKKAVIDKTLDGYRVTYPDSTQWIFSGYCQAVGPSAPAREGELTANVVIRPSGPMIIAAVQIG